MRQYLELVRHVLGNGTHKEGRNGGTLSVFGYTYKHDLCHGFPLLTTKKIYYASVFDELVWYLSGKPHIRDLQENGHKFWDLWADERGYVQSPYGWFWRNWGKRYQDGPNASTDTSGDGIDQLAYILHDLNTQPNSRRMALTAWDPVNAWQSNLPPCHDFTVFNVQEGRLNAHLTQRSGDIALGIPFNLACYSALIHLMAHLSGLQPGVFAHTIVDAHIYRNHIEGLREQLTRRTRHLPRLAINPNLRSLDDVTAGDFVLTDYSSEDFIKFEVSP